MQVGPEQQACRLTERPRGPSYHLAGRVSEWGHWPGRRTQGWSLGERAWSRLFREAHSTRGGASAGEEALVSSKKERAATQYFTNPRKPLLLLQRIPFRSYFY